MITETDSYATLDLGRYYVILPTTPAWSVDDYIAQHDAKRVEEGFKYNSGTNDDWLSVEQLRAQIVEHVDAGFVA
jgi:hypothetical protein